MTSTMNTEENDIRQIYTKVKSIPSYSSKINEFLKSNETSSLHRRVTKRRFPTRKIITYYPYQILMADLIEYTQPGYRHANGGNKYILLVIDCFSKFVWTRPLKKKDKISTAEAFKSILESLKEIPNSIITDEGLEFYNKPMNELYDKYSIIHYSIKTARKASIAERAIQTLKNRFEKYFYQYKTKRWIDVLDQFTENYNQTPHRSIGMAPASVNETNRAKVFKQMFPHINDRIKPRLKKGDIVRLLEKKKLFDKGYRRSWSTDLYAIASVHQRAGVEWYKLEDKDGKINQKAIYYWELNKVSK